MNTKVSYSEKLRSPLWQRKRLEILQRDKFCCQLCLDEETELQIHHLEYIRGNEPWEYEGYQLTTLCKDCHAYVSCKKSYPYRIFKKVNEDGAFLLVIDDNGISFSHPSDYSVYVSHSTLKDVVQSLINYWLLNGKENLLND